jgi:hypothetical protein
MTVVVDHPAGISRLFMEVPGTSGNNDPASRFQLWSLNGDPTTPDDDNVPITGDRNPLSGDVDAFPCITTISINNSIPNATDQVLEDLSNRQDGGDRGYWPLMPTARSRDVVYRMLVGIDDDDPSVATEIIEVSQEAVLLRDTLKLDYILTNRGTQSHAVGLRIFIDCTFGVGSQDGRQIILSDGTIVDTEEAFPPATGGRIPDGWVAFDNMVAPATILRGTITGGEVSDSGLATYSAGPPDRVEFGQRVNMGRDNQWLFTPTSSSSIVGEDWGYAVRWDEETLAAGASRRYVTYYGLGGSASDFSPPYVLAAYAPFQLQVVEDDDPLTPGTIEEAYLADETGSSTWDVLAYCDNFGSGSILDARAFLSLPAGFELDTSGGPQSRTVYLGTIPRNVQASARWQVRATPDVRPGVHEIRVSGPLGRSVRHKISIPALPTLPQAHLDPLRGLDMVTVPYNFQITDAEHVFQSLGSLESSDAALIRWDPDAQPQPRYQFFPNTFVSNVEPGVGYWLVNRLRLPIEFPADRELVDEIQPFPIVLSEGWNQIGSPFVATIRLDQASVVGPDGIDRRIRDAASAGLIVPTLFHYNPVTNDYGFETVLADAVLEPYVGYWILALRPVTLVLSPPTLIPFKQGAPASVAAMVPDDGWRAPLLVEMAGTVRTGRALGQSSAASDGPDLADIICPPDAAAADGARLAAYFYRPDWAEPLRRCLTDIRSMEAGQQTWNLVVVTDARGQDVSLSWPDLTTMPNHLVATLEDLQTGRSCFMRANTGYVYNSGQGGARQFRIAVRERGGASLQIMGFNQSRTANGIRMACTLSADANVDVQIRNIAGRVVKRVWAGREVAAGDIEILWTGRDQRGLAVPNGPYIVEIIARSPEDGEQTGIIRPVHYYR